MFRPRIIVLVEAIHDDSQNTESKSALLHTKTEEGKGAKIDNKYLPSIKRLHSAGDRNDITVSKSMNRRMVSSKPHVTRRQAYSKVGDSAFSNSARNITSCEMFPQSWRPDRC